MPDWSDTTHHQIPRDPSRRYLVVGDLHGRFETMTALLESAQYDPVHDVLLSVGDLIDRGPRSLEIIEFFKAPGRYVVRGNHEQMVLDHSKWSEVWNYPQNGGPATSRSLDRANKSIEWLQDQICHYPVCLDVGEDSDDQAFRLVHAEYPFDWSETQFRSTLEESGARELGDGRLLWGRSDIEAIVWGRNPTVHTQRSSRRGFCGHTPLEQVTSAHNTYWIDTFEAATLTCIDAVTLEQWSVPVQSDEFPA